MLSVKLQSANKVCEKATKLFRICDEHGIGKWKFILFFMFRFGNVVNRQTSSHSSIATTATGKINIKKLFFFNFIKIFKKQKLN